MTDKELIQALRAYSCQEWTIPNKAADRLEALLAENEHLREVTKMMPRWVSVKERLPESNDRAVLVIVNGVYDGIHFYDAVEIADFVWDEGWILESYPDWENPNISYWANLPEPPSTEGVE